MILSRLWISKAILLMGVAFTIISCRPPVPVKRPELIKPLKDYFKEAETLFHKGKYKEAFHNYQNYLKNNPSGKYVPNALMKMGMILFSEKRHRDSLSFFQTITKEYPHHEIASEALFWMAMVKRALKEPNESVEIVNRWLKTYPHHPLKGRVIRLKVLSLIDMDKGQEAFIQAIAGLKDPEIDPEQKKSIVNDITSLIQRGNIEQLIRMKQMANSSPLLNPILYRLASLYFENRRFLKAKDEIINMIENTWDETWISKAKELLTNIEEAFHREEKSIGCVLPLSGKISIFGREVLNGILLALNPFGEQNSPELIVVDNMGEANKTKNAIMELIQNRKVKVIIGPLLSKNADVAVDMAQSNGIPIITLTQKEDITLRGEMVYRNFFTPQKQIHALLEKSVKEMGIKRFAILYPDTEYGRTYMSIFMKELGALGGHVTVMESYDPKETDFTEHIKNMTGISSTDDEHIKEIIDELRAIMAEDEIDESLFSDEEPFPVVDFEAIFIPDDGKKVAMIIPQFPFMNVFDICYLGTEAWLSPQLPVNAGDYMELSLFPAPFFPDNPTAQVKEFVEKYKKTFKTEPRVLSATGYETMKLLINIMNGQIIVSREDIKDALQNFSGLRGPTGFIKFDETGDVVKKPLLLTVKGKRFALFDYLQKH